MSKHTGKFLFASFIGAVAGALGGLLLAPKSGKETRKDIINVANEINKSIKLGSEEAQKRTKEVFGQATKAATEKYKTAREAVIEKLAAIKKAGQTVDKEKYMMIVKDVITEFKDDLGVTKEGIGKLSMQFRKDWLKVKKALG